MTTILMVTSLKKKLLTGESAQMEAGASHHGGQIPQLRSEAA